MVFRSLSKPFSINFGPQGTFSFYLRPVEHFFMLMRSMSRFEFETVGFGRCATMASFKESISSNVFCVPFLCESLFGSFILVTFWQKSTFAQKPECKMLMKLTTVANFINILLTNVLYKRHFGSLFTYM